jgi:hypothetical protein
MESFLTNFFTPALVLKSRVGSQGGLLWRYLRSLLLTASTAYVIDLWYKQRKQRVVQTRKNHASMASKVKDLLKNKVHFDARKSINSFPVRYGNRCEPCAMSMHAHLLDTDRITGTGAWEATFPNNPAACRERFGIPVLPEDGGSGMTEVRTTPNGTQWRVNMSQPGLHINGKTRLTGGSPDGIFEVKFPGGKWHVRLAEYKCPQNLYQKLPHEYECQIMIMMGTLREEGVMVVACDFLVWTTQRCFVKTVPWDQARYDELMRALVTFYMEMLLPRFVLRDNGLLRPGHLEPDTVITISRTEDEREKDEKDDVGYMTETILKQLEVGDMDDEFATDMETMV